MSPPSMYRRPPRGRPLIGFELEVPGDLELEDGESLRCREVLRDGRIAGELELGVFTAALIIDPDGILAEKACAVLGGEAPVPHGATAVALRLPGASGFRADAVGPAPLPYRSVLAIAPHDACVDGGLLVVIRSVRPDWPAADAMLRSLRVLTRGGVGRA